MSAPRSIPLPPLFALAALALWALPLVSTSCTLPRQCLDDSYCIRQCECESSATGDIIDCPVQFNCDLDAEICEDDYTNLSCGEICQQFAPAGLCGARRCETEADCVRSVTCNSLDENGQVVGTFDCDRAFVCDADALACELGFSTMTDSQICQECAVTAN